MAEERAQRRLAAILAADVVGYSRLMAQDESGTLAALKARRKGVLEPLVARYVGRIFKITGDGVLIEFSSAVNAVQCAIELQQAMAAANSGLPDDAHIVLRIGINLGDVIVEGSDLYGDGVNIAARLESTADPGSILVSATAHEHVKNKINAGFDDLGPQALKNIAEPVRAYRVTDTPLVAMAPSKAKTNKPSIAVLPFVNMSADPDQEYFADGLTEDIITALSHVSGLTVIARTSSFAYKDRKVDTKRVAKELNVGYVMEGSVRRANDRVRVTAQLIDGVTGHHVWAERYDQPAGNIFDIQDEIMRSVAASTEIQIQMSERYAIESRTSSAPKAGELVAQAWGRIYDYTPEAFVAAAELTDKAILLDPTNPRAHIIRARIHMNRMWFGVVPHTEANVALALQLAEMGLRLAPRDEWAHYCMGFAHELMGRTKDAFAEYRRTIELNPNFSNGHAGCSRMLAIMGESSEAIEACRMALRLNPRDPTNWERHNTLAIAHFVAGNDEMCLKEARITVQACPVLPEGLIMLAAAASSLGAIDEARRATAQCVSHSPGIRLENMAPVYLLRLMNQDDRERLSALLVKSGFPQ